MAAEVQVLITGKNMLGRAVADAQRDLAGLERSAGGIGRVLAGAGKLALGGLAIGGAALGGVVVGATRSAAQFEQQMANVQAVLQANSADAERLRKAALDIALDPTLKVSIDGVGAAMEMLAKNGMTTEQILGGVAKSTVLLANASGGDMALAADTLTSSMLMFNRTSADSEEMVNSMTGVMNASKFDANDYSYAITNLGGFVGSLGLSFEEANDFIAAVAPSFRSGREAGTSLEYMFRGLNPKTKEATARFKELGIITKEGKNQFFDLNGELQDADEIVRILRTSFAGMSTQQQMVAMGDMFDISALPAIMRLVSMTAAEWENLQATIDNTDAMDAAATRTRTLQGAWEVLGDTLQATGIAIGMGWNEPLRQFVVSLSEATAAVAPLVVGAMQPLSEWVSNTLTGASKGLDSFKTQLEQKHVWMGMGPIELEFDWSGAMPKKRFSIGDFFELSTLGDAVAIEVGKGFKMGWGGGGEFFNLDIGEFLNVSKFGPLLAAQVGEGLRAGWNQATGNFKIESSLFGMEKTGQLIRAHIGENIQAGFVQGLGKFTIDGSNFKISNLSGVFKAEIGKAFSASVEGGKVTVKMGDGGFTIDWGGMSTALQQSFVAMRQEIQTAFATDGLAGVGGVVAGWAVGLKDGIVAEFERAFVGTNESRGDPTQAPGAASGGYVTEWVTARKQEVLDAINTAFGTSFGEEGGTTLTLNAESFNNAIGIVTGAMGMLGNLRVETLTVAMDTVTGVIGSVAEAAAKFALGVDATKIEDFFATFLDGVTTGLDTALDEANMGKIGTAAGTLVGAIVTKFSEVIGDGTLGTKFAASIVAATDSLAEGAGALVKGFANALSGVDWSEVGASLNTFVSQFVQEIEETYRARQERLTQEWMDAGVPLAQIPRGTFGQITRSPDTDEMGRNFGRGMIDFLSGLFGGADTEIDYNRRYGDVDIARSTTEAAAEVSRALVQLTSDIDSRGLDAQAQAYQETLDKTGIVFEGWGAILREHVLPALQLGPMPQGWNVQGMSFGAGAPTMNVAPQNVVVEIPSEPIVDSMIGAVERINIQSLMAGSAPTLDDRYGDVEIGATNAAAALDTLSAAAANAARPVESMGILLQPPVPQTPPPSATAIDTSGISSVLSGFDWPALPEFSWPPMPQFSWPSYPAFRWPTIERPGWLSDMKVPRPGWLGEMLSWSPVVSVRIAGGGGSSTDSGGGGGSAPTGGEGGTFTIDSNARGTNWFGGGLTWVGETGPELVSLPRGSRIYSHNESSGMGGAISVIVNAAVSDNIDIERIAYRVADLIQRRGR